MIEMIHRSLLTVAAVMTLTLIMLTAGVVGAYSKPLQPNTKMPVLCMPKEALKKFLQHFKMMPIGSGDGANGFRAALFYNPKTTKYAMVGMNAERGFGCVLGLGAGWAPIKIPKDQGQPL